MQKGSQSVILGLIVNVLPLVVITVVLLGLNLKSDGWGLALKGLDNAWKTTLKFSPVLVFMCLAMGQSDVLINRHRDAIKQGMSGEGGLLASFMAGIFSPGSLSGLPIVKVMWEEGFPKVSLVVFLIASTVINLQTMLMRAPFMGWRIAAIQYGICLGISIAFLAAIWTYGKLFGP